MQAFRDTEITLPVDRSSDLELKIKCFAPRELTVGNWIRYKLDIEHGTSENGNAELLTLTVSENHVEYHLRDA